MTKPNLGKQRSWTGAYSGQSVDRNTSKVAGDVPCDLSTRDRVRDAGGGSDYNSLPSDRPNYYTGPDGFLLGKQISGIDEADPDGSRALQKDWHRKAGFSQEVSRTGNHPGRGTTNMKSRGADTDTAGQGSPKGSKFSWQ
jgi:hypothetical protein